MYWKFQELLYIFFLQKLEDPWLIKSSGSELSVGRTFQANGIWQIGKKSSKISLSHKCENRCFDLITFELTKRFPFAQIRINHIKNSQKNTRNSKKTQGILQKPQGFEKKTRLGGNVNLAQVTSKKSSKKPPCYT